jgi:uncharacterized membrane protein YgaE (UPF0421/DUF939 family)
VLVGVSRTSKTPLSMYLGYMGYKTANVPLVKGIEPPKELFELDPAKIVGLTIDATRLAEIRQARVRQMRANPKAYAELVEIYDELEHAEAIHRRLGCPVLDITEQSIEETASRVVKLVEDRKRRGREDERRGSRSGAGASGVPARRRDVPLLHPADADLDRPARARMGRGVQSAAHALERLEALWLPILQSALAAALAWWIAHDLIGHSSAFFAPIAALIALGVGVTNRPRRVVELTLGVAVGIGVGDALIWGIGSGVWQLGLIVLLAMVAAVLLGGGPLFVSQAASSAVLVATLVGAHNGSRFVDALVGGAIGLAVLVAVPIDPLGRAKRAGEEIFAELAATLEDVAAALEARDVAAVREALARARASEALVVGWRQAIEIGRETALLSPLRWSGRSRLEVYAVAAEQLELAVRNTRVLARAAIRAVELDPDLPPEIPAAVRRLADAVRLTEDVLDARDHSRAIEPALEAARLATRALEADPDLTAAHLVGQVRATAADLLRALGLDRADAVARVRAAV